MCLAAVGTFSKPLIPTEMCSVYEKGGIAVEHAASKAGGITTTSEVFSVFGKSEIITELAKHNINCTFVQDRKEATELENKIKDQETKESKRSETDKKIEFLIVWPFETAKRTLGILHPPLAKSAYTWSPLLVHSSDESFSSYESFKIKCFVKFLKELVPPEPKHVINFDLLFLEAYDLLRLI